MTNTRLNRVPPSEWDRVFKRQPKEFDKAPIGSSDPVIDFGEHAGPDSLDDHSDMFQEWDSLWQDKFFNELDNMEFDPVQKPAHYNNGGIEAIAYIRQQLGDNFSAYCEGNVIKYLHRHKYKNGIQDLEKAQWYLDRMIEAWKEY